MERTKVGLIGCGNISQIYLESPGKFPNIEIIACADLDLSRAQAKAREHGLTKALSVDEILADPEVEILVNLTIPAAHAAVSRRILEAGKHAYSEKPLATSRAEAAALLALAEAKGLRVGGAPDTFLGAGLQTCRKLIDGGQIGEPIGAAGWMLGPGHERWHPDPEFYYQPGAGPLFDMGPYYLTALVSLLGPVRRVTGSARISFPERTISSKPRQGQKIQVNTATHLAAVLDFASGAIATLSTSFDVQATTLPPLEVYGSEGTLVLPDPNNFGGPIKMRRRGEAAFVEMPLEFPHESNMRGIGVAEMAAAIRGNRPHRASGEMAAHVLDLMIAVQEASDRGQHIEAETSMQRPAAFPADLKVGRVE